MLRESFTATASSSHEIKVYAPPSIIEYGRVEELTEDSSFGGGIPGGGGPGGGGSIVIP